MVAVTLTISSFLLKKSGRRDISSLSLVLLVPWHFSWTMQPLAFLERVQALRKAPKLLGLEFFTPSTFELSYPLFFLCLMQPP